MALLGTESRRSARASCLISYVQTREEQTHNGMQLKPSEPQAFGGLPNSARLCNQLSEGQPYPDRQRGTKSSLPAQKQTE